MIWGVPLSPCFNFWECGSVGHTPGEIWTVWELSWHIELPTRMEEQGEGFEKAGGGQERSA